MTGIIQMQVGKESDNPAVNLSPLVRTGCGRNKSDGRSSSENDSQPPRDHSHAPVRGNLAHARVSRQGLVVQRATKHPHSR